MSGSIGRVSGGVSGPTGAAHTAAAEATDARNAKLRKAAGDFESLLVKQLLKEAKIGGSETNGGYGDMAVDALASAVEKGGGLGLSKAIEHAIHGGVDAHPSGSQAASAPSPSDGLPLPRAKKL